MKYSFIILTHNSSEHILKCLKSIYNQKCMDFEVLIIDDSSTDNTCELIESQQKTYNNLLLFKRPKLGISNQRNFGINNARGEYIIFVDSDDYIEDNSLDKIDKILSINNLDILKCGVNCIDFKAYDGRFDCSIFNNLTGLDALIKFCEKKNIFATPWSYIIKREFIIKNNLEFMENTLHEDYGLLPIIISKADSVSSVDIKFYNYVKYSNSSITKNDFDNEVSRMNDFLIHTYNLLNYFSKNINEHDKKEKIIEYILERLNIKYSHLTNDVKNNINSFLYNILLNYNNIKYSNSDDKIERILKKHSLDNIPIEYKINLKLMINLAKEVFKNNLQSVTLGGSAGKNKIIAGWSDLDIYIVLKEYDIKKVCIFNKLISKFSQHIGVTYYTILEVENNLIDNKTKVMLYEKRMYNVNPTLLGKDIFNNITYSEIVNNDIMMLPNVIHEFRRMHASILNDNSLFSKKYLKKLLVLIKCYLNINHIFTYGYDDVIEEFIVIINKPNSLTRCIYFDIIWMIENYQNNINEILEFGEVTLNYIVKEMER